MFSPYYARARRAGFADPHNHVALNVALYGLHGPGWAMTERSRAALQRSPDTLRIGPSSMTWRDGALHIAIDAVTVPVPRRLRGQIVLRPTACFDTEFAIDVAGRHRWTPMAPCAHVEVSFDQPRWCWSGHGYFDSNDGDRPLEQDFSTWEWSRATLPDRSTVVLYDGARRDGSDLALAHRFNPDGTCEPIPMPPRRTVQSGLWGMTRTTHGEAAPRLLRRLEDAPFYTRSLIETRLQGQDVVAVHESLSLTRFSKRWVQVLLPFRMPRRS